MELARSVDDCRTQVAAARRSGRRIVFVPTMGALHAGHTALMAAAKPATTAATTAAPLLVVSIFVNPTQFAAGEDFARYPRNEAADLKTCGSAGADLVFLPSAADMYPGAGDVAARTEFESLTTIHVARLSETLCGRHRPGHFDGVATVVAKLLNIVQPDAAFFGEKDYQQLTIVRRMVRDLNLPVEIVGVPTVREADGLALSSRNQYLSPVERAQAASLSRALHAGAAAIREGTRAAAVVEDRMRRVIESAGPSRIDYVSIVQPDDLQPVSTIIAPVQLALAVRIGQTRLIDNLRVDPRL